MPVIAVRRSSSTLDSRLTAVAGTLQNITDSSEPYDMWHVQLWYIQMKNTINKYVCKDPYYFALNNTDNKVKIIKK